MPSNTQHWGFPNEQCLLRSSDSIETAGLSFGLKPYQSHLVKGLLQYGLCKGYYKWP